VSGGRGVQARGRAACVAGALALVVTGCGGGVDGASTGAPATATTVARPPAGSADAATSSSTSADGATTTLDPAAPSTSPTPAPTTAPVRTTAPPALPVTLPGVQTDPATLAAELVAVEQQIRDPATPAADLSELGHRQQLAYRTLSQHPDWDAAVLAAVTPELGPVVALNVGAHREALGMFHKLSDTLPAWRIVEPLPGDELLGYYREAEAASGVEWEYLAAINLVETGMGRIVGLSSAGAQGPMQFIPETWAAYGQGDVWNARDAIAAAARYLAAKGAPGDMDRAIWSYNNHNNYVRAVKSYAAVLRADPQAFWGYYHWQIQYYCVAGDLWLAAGYEQAERVPAVDWAAAHPERVSGPPPPVELFER
jgi:hypothetical protein